MIGFRFKRTIKLSMKGLWLHKLRSGLTALGIVFGVTSVVAMLAIGEGISHEAQEQIRRLGSRNIIITTVKPPTDNATSTSGNTLLEYGITYKDLERIKATIPNINIIVPVREIRQNVKYRQRKTEGVIMGTTPWFQRIRRLPMLRGRFLTGVDMHQQKSMCVINQQVEEDVFAYESAVGKNLKIGGDYYRVTGVVDDSIMSVGAETDSSRRIFIPITTARSRFGEIALKIASGSREMERVQLHQATIEVEVEGRVVEIASAIRALMERFHKQPDFELIVPLELLKQAERAKQFFKVVLGAIAAISLLVGGIGIMNIMLASVTERTREIGIRRALGAKKRDIIVQFLSETVLLSVSGGLVGILLGIAAPSLLGLVVGAFMSAGVSSSDTSFAKMQTIITPWSVVLASSISVAIGVVFGLYPAQRAANLDPIEALRHE
ncbi:MAG: ABC transporter permease [Planctomycetes bacterium]|nr:ABC transporter permease [Planctomycetota bacterium]